MDLKKKMAERRSFQTISFMNRKKVYCEDCRFVESVLSQVGEFCFVSDIKCKSPNNFKGSIYRNTTEEINFYNACEWYEPKLWKRIKDWFRKKLNTDRKKA